ncbi:unnamed protein product [Paramecium pentaurelia]|uniref:Uncharacterized protein n=1 Tax=Paramecium pentaurelia TaxID=43138 RepID=A0A8S1UQ23_9CILI|nr:unnamed protein product [Paramecium pentaurelia]
MKQIVINFSDLNDEAKKKYIKFFEENKINVENQSLKKSQVAQQHRTRQYSALSDIANSKAFTPAKSQKQGSQHFKMDHSVGAKFSDLEETYPKIMNKIQNKDLLSRPLKLSFNELNLLIEEIYQKKFIEDSNKIAKNQKVQEIEFVDYVYEFLFNKFKHSKNQLIINFLASVELNALKRKDINIFQQFMKSNKQEVLKFYLFTRALIQNELKLSFYHPLRKQGIDCNQLQLNQKQVQQISLLLYGSPENYQEFKKFYSGNSISVTEFQFAAILIYETHIQTNKQKSLQQQPRSLSPLKITNNNNDSKDIRQSDSHLFMQSEMSIENNKQQNENFFSSTVQSFSSQKNQQWKVQIKFHRMTNVVNNVQKLINEKLETKLSDFIEEMLSEMEDLTDDQKKECVSGIEERIVDTVAILLDAIYKFDKLLWFKKLNKQPDELGLEYIENLQKLYRSLVKAKQPLDDQLEQLCQQMMQTPNLAKQIGNELLQYFYNCE